MQQTATPTPNSPSFAGMLAALAAPKTRPTAAWDDDGLADDVVNLSYERALRARALYRSRESGDRSLTMPPEPEPLPIRDLSVEVARQTAAAGEKQPAECLVHSERIPVPLTEPGPAPRPSTALLANLRAASITIRVSKPEAEQLRKRAAEAGLTVSAYVRSCTFEAESLRAQVKETLMQLRSATTQPKPTPPAPSRQSWFHWLLRLWPHSRAGRPVAIG
jgi:hypothetical protein